MDIIYTCNYDVIDLVICAILIAIRNPPVSIFLLNKINILNRGVNLKSSHDGFVFTIPLILAIGLIIFTTVIVITQVVVAVGGPLIPQLITEMPRFFDYGDTTGDLILDANGNPAPNERTELYFGLFVFSFIILIVVGILSILVLLLESIKWVDPGTATPQG